MKLDAVRRYRAQVEEVARMELLVARQHLEDADMTCRTLEAQMQATSEGYVAKAGLGMALEEFIELQAACDAQAASLAQARQVEARLREEWNRKQQALRDAMQERRTLDRLAERQRSQSLAMQHRLEHMQMDEAARRAGAMGGLQNPL